MKLNNLLNLIFYSFFSVFNKQNKFTHVFRLLFLIPTFYIFSPCVNAQTFNLPTTNTTGTFSIDWSGGAQTIRIEEQASSGWTIVVSGGSSGNTVINKTVSGTYTYQLINCVFDGRNMNCAPVGATKSITVTLSGPPVGTNYTTTYTYDELGRLKTAINPNSIKNTYSYDAADNRTKKESAPQ